MHSLWSVQFRNDVAVTGDESEVVLEGEFSRLTVRNLPSAMLAAIRDIAPPGIGINALAGRALESGMPDPVARLVHYLQQFARHGLLTLSTTAEGRPVATLDPISFYFRWPRVTPIEGRFVLSRFAYTRRLNDQLVLESPLSKARIILEEQPAAEAVFALSEPQTVNELVERLGLSSEETTGLVAQFNAAEMLAEVGDQRPEVGGRKSEVGGQRSEVRGQKSEVGSSDDEALSTLNSQPSTLQNHSPLTTHHSPLATWDFHDLLFHTRSRNGRHDAPLGAMYPFMGELDPPPAVKPIDHRNAIELEVPDLSARCREESPFAEVVERRRSIREFGDPPVSLSQLGEFLYRCMRVRERYDLEVETPRGPLTMDFISRPYPSGGALYELEVYPIVQRCDGLEAGLYYYDGVDHRLLRVSQLTPDAVHLLDEAGLSSGIDADTIQVLFIVSARFSRMAWKYSSMAYAAILKHVGVVYQAMYLTATAMNLAPCALGAGDSDAFASAIGGNYYEETSVGEFLLGSVGEGGEW